ncbi:hypothetical protein Clacol_009661 [Clathrus columnatus]|uniref:Uncharacterized protein n=1 Tax=Clathrus columnatus TaxID=1419009 RepID=A0AAV5AU17_9AGAM|nr:hypothetical protein Clacol_009661 [Clathrus columnatus]
MALPRSEEKLILKDLTNPDLMGATEVFQTEMGTVLVNIDGDLNPSVKEESGFTEETATEAITNPLYIRPKDHPNELTAAINGLPHIHNSSRKFIN